jgi:predicted polyphosphate/ATP-dependent NAD kinase
VSIVGIVVNPLAGKDIRRLVANASPVSDAAKIGMVRRAVVGAAESGARRILVSGDHHQLGRRATQSLDLAHTGASVEILDDHVLGARDDSVVAAARLADEGAGAVVVFGGDGTNRDVASGWPDAPVVPVSTGTNNVFPIAWDATSAGSAAGLVASGVVALADASNRAKRITVHITSPGKTDIDDVALVEVALVSGSFVGSRAVWDPSRIQTVVAAIATPASTGLASIAGRALPVDRCAPSGTVVHMGPGGRRIRLPLSPGSFVTVDVADASPLGLGETVTLRGPGVITFDGERSHVLGPDGTAQVTIRPDGPHVIDVERTLSLAALGGHFDVSSHVAANAEPRAIIDPTLEDPHVD